MSLGSRVRMGGWICAISLPERSVCVISVLLCQLSPTTLPPLFLSTVSQYVPLNCLSISQLSLKMSLNLSIACLCKVC